MENKEVYEHLANIYLDTPVRRQQRNNNEHRRGPYKALIVISIVLVIVALNILLFWHFSNRNRSKTPVDGAFERVIQSEIVELKFDFGPAKKEIYSIDLNSLDLSGFRVVEFSAKKSDSHANLALRMEFVNGFKEKSEVYIRDIASRWQTYRLHLEDFKDIHDWSQVRTLSFTMEEWNSSDKKGAVYIDDVRFLK